MNQRMKICYGVGLIILILVSALLHKPGISDTQTPAGYSAPKSFQQVRLDQEKAFQKALAEYDREQAKLVPQPVMSKSIPAAKISRKVAFKSKTVRRKGIKTSLSLVKFKATKEAKKLKRVL